jgi:uncharacterized protein
MRSIKIDYPLLILTLILTALVFQIAWMRIRIDADITQALPHNDSVLTDAVYIFKHHPVQDQIAIDVGIDRIEKDLLVEIADNLELQLRESKLFKRVGMEEIHRLIPLIVQHVGDHLPLLFTATELENEVAPLLTPQALATRLKTIQESLLSFSSIGQSEYIASDPFGLRDLKLKELSSLAPSQQAQIYRGRLLSENNQHLIVFAQPYGSGTDTASAARIMDLLKDMTAKIKNRYAENPAHITITPVGAFRAALDNEVMVRKDVNNALLLSTIGIAGLLIVTFPRPLLGLFALLPSIVGTSIAFLIFSFIRESISIMALGFGGSLISITVDYGIAYLLFLDRPFETSGKGASEEVWGVGLLTTFTTVGAFTALSFSGFPIFEEIGMFTAIGVCVSFLFVHTLLPRIFPLMPPAKNPKNLPLQKWVDAMAKTGKKGAWAALLVGAFLLFWIKPTFNVDLSAMNTLSQETQSAEKLFKTVWGDIFSKIYLMTEAESLESLQEKGDRLLSVIEKGKSEGVLASGFPSSRIYPGAEQSAANLLAWKTFWSPQRIATLRDTLSPLYPEFGFTPNAFKPFFIRLTDSVPMKSTTVPKELFPLFGIQKNDVDARWRQCIGVTAGPQYDGERFYSQVSASANVFDARLFSSRMGNILFTTFGKMLFMAGIGVIIMIFFFFVDWRLTFLSLIPILFSFFSTLGTLSLMGRSLDIPGLMLAIIILGMGVDYSLFFIDCYQRYQYSGHSSFSLIRTSVFMASAANFIGYGALCVSQHTLLQSAGLTSLLGIGYSMIAAFLILPPILERRFHRPKIVRLPGNARILKRYQNMRPYPRLFAKFKLIMDPMFSELEDILPPVGHSLETIMDIGSGYGVPASWLLHRYPHAGIFGIEPIANRVHIASIAVGPDGRIFQGAAPNVPEIPNSADMAFMLDMCHYLDDEAFQLTLSRIFDRLKKGGRCIIRAVLRPKRKCPWLWWLENARIRYQRAQSFYRSVDTIKSFLSELGFAGIESKESGPYEEMVWIIAGRPE